MQEIKRKQLYFTGEHHQKYGECVPILNDGYKRSFSRRAWASLMAEAYNKTEEYDYVNFMDIDYSYSYRFPEVKIKIKQKKNIEDLIQIFHITSSDIIKIDETQSQIALKGLKKFELMEAQDEIVYFFNGKEERKLVQKLNWAKTSIEKGKKRFIIYINLYKNEE